MSIKGKETPLKVTNNATYKVVDGVTYFKLKSEFPGDYTKNCGLLGEEIDENMYFLRGYDIESLEIDENRNLIIHRIDKDYEPLVVNIGEKIGQPTFSFNKETGTILITYPDGTNATMDGFLVEGRDIRIATDSSIGGNGTIYNPIRIAETERTGTFSPAVKYFDLTEGEKMPIGEGKGYRVVTKEKIDNFGCLYPFEAVEKIQEKLIEKGSEWRVPSKADWDDLLNALECAEDRNHNASISNWLGKVAGSGLKSADLWKKHVSLSSEIPTDGQDVRGLTIYPVGITPDRNEILNESDYDVEGFRQIAGMWSSTLNDEGNAYVKIFGYNSAKVDQDTYGKGARMSIRLCKEYNYNNFNEIEEILDFPYPTVLVYGIHDDYPYVKIWTKINLYSHAESLNGIRSEEWANVSDSDRGVKIVYFINEWDGYEWHKKPMKDGDSIVIIDYKNENPYHEWRMINGELVDTVKAIMDEFSDELSKINNRIDEEIENREKADTVIKGEIDKEIKNRENADAVIEEKLSNEIQNRKDSDAAIKRELENEIQNRKDADTLIKNDLISEIQNRKDADAVIEKNLANEIQNRKDADAVIEKNLTDEIQNRKDADIAIKQELENEIQNRKDADAVIEKNLADEIQNRKDAIEKEISERHAHDITPGEYVLNGASDKEMILPTNGNDVPDVKIIVSDDFFNFGPILNE